MTSKRNSERHDVAELARCYNIAPSTLRKRLNRHGDLDRALRDKPLTSSQAGKIGAARSPWRHPGA